MRWLLPLAKIGSFARDYSNYSTGVDEYPGVARHWHPPPGLREACLTRYLVLAVLQYHCMEVWNTMAPDGEFLARLQPQNLLLSGAGVRETRLFA